MSSKAEYMGCAPRRICQIFSANAKQLILLLLLTLELQVPPGADNQVPDWLLVVCYSGQWCLLQESACHFWLIWTRPLRWGNFTLMFCQTLLWHYLEWGWCPNKTTPWEDCFLTLSALRQSSIDLQSRFAGQYGQRLSIDSRLSGTDFTILPTTVRGRGERYVDCCADSITSFGGGSVMVWDGISLTERTRLAIIGGNVNAERYRDEILQPVAIPYLHNLGLNPIIQEDNASPPTERDFSETTSWVWGWRGLNPYA